METQEGRSDGDQRQGDTLMTYLSQSWVGYVASGEVTIMASCGGGGGVELAKPNGLPGAVPQLHPPGERRNRCLQTDLHTVLADSSPKCPIALVRSSGREKHLLWQGGLDRLCGSIEVARL